LIKLIELIKLIGLIGLAELIESTPQPLTFSTSVFWVQGSGLIELIGFIKLIVPVKSALPRLNMKKGLTGQARFLRNI
jgi:hypothetical protein